ncbi:type VII secretion-associated serine protease mycosin [Paractinoplanes ferrugineus]|uniref:Type VII secretion-associated serine protease n=1 Tax=Paractinoplanes ferrugineus TaxID=113564 RepID=A0A919ITB3_9ACTN|nr:S8 family serine peptidase [Actinoplanes ferrugineus]GIE08620.1 type VII secretion-associated serine protease [Actinoplanes ferrugineus]
MRLKVSVVAAAALLVAAVTGPVSPARADSFRADQWYLKSLDVPRAHAISTGAGVIVGLVDTGAYPHPDVQRNLLSGTDLIPGESGDGRSDKDGHGTEMAALIAAHGRGADDGVLGIAPSAKVLPIKTSNDGNKAPSKEIGDGMRWAVDQKASVINVSAAVGPAFDIEDAAAAAAKADVVVVAGVGNTATSAIIGYPAAIEGVLAVGATDRSGKHAALSVKDSKVQICAPGVDITTAAPPKKYVDVDGTSAATAIVSGAVALVRAKFPSLSAPEVVHQLTATADDIGPPGKDKECGFGRLNLVKALTADVPPLKGTSASAKPGEGSTPPTTTSTAGTAPSAGADPASNNMPLVIGGVLVGLAVAGGLVAALIFRRRRSF